MKRRVWLGLVAVLSIGVGLVAPLPWLLGLVEPTPGGMPLGAHLFERFTAAQLVFVAHVGGGGLALVVGPWQLMKRMRRRWPRLHRATGYVYVAAVAVGGTAGLVLGPTAWAGPIAQAGFTALAIAWLATTALGVQRILSGDRTGHRAWMTRSFALAFAAVSLRIQFPLFAAIGLPAAVGYTIVAWSSWLPNLVVAHVVLARRNSAGETPVHRRNARVNELCSENPSR
ncbi:MAG TPA: DUF2306 domain-containing protein [Kofleriaceae bacterium]|nr:DUF2306 domain-containing protein [Kofleriaceae bacterium]